MKGIYTGKFNTSVGECLRFMCDEPESLKLELNSIGRLASDGEETETKEVDKFAMGNLAGWEMAVQGLQDQGFPGFQFRDKVTIECIDLEAASNREYSAMPIFEVNVER